MESTMIKALLEKYWMVETSVEEEAQLKAYFRGPEVAPDLEPYRALFSEIDQALMPTSALSDERIMERIGAAGGSVRPLYRKGWWYAAAAVLVISLGIGLGRNEPAPLVPAVAASTVKDTYDDPAKALAAVQKALRTVSVRMNKGKEITQAGMGRLSADYHLAFRD
jgi:hypothetical protein